jgi:hypothetical protein
MNMYTALLVALAALMCGVIVYQRYRMNRIHEQRKRAEYYLSHALQRQDELRQEGRKSDQERDAFREQVRNELIAMRNRLDDVAEFLDLDIGDDS